VLGIVFLAFSLFFGSTQIALADNARAYVLIEVSQDKSSQPAIDKLGGSKTVKVPVSAAMETKLLRLLKAVA
jgi:hypothetical protein